MLIKIHAHVCEDGRESVYFRTRKFSSCARAKQPCVSRNSRARNYRNPNPSVAEGIWRSLPILENWIQAKEHLKKLRKVSCVV